MILTPSVVLCLAVACSVGPATTAGQTPSGLSAVASPGTITAGAATGVTRPPSAPASPTSSTAPAPVRQGTPAASTRKRFVPTQIQLPSGDTAVVEPAQTADGALQVPDDVRHVGWWDGGAYAGDPFGATVLAGHVDSREQGFGFFAELLRVQIADVITVQAANDALRYQVVSITLVDKQALATDSDALKQNGPHRLVLITCSGQWRPEVRSYDSNLVVVAQPMPA